MTPAARPALSGLIPAHAGKTPTAYPFWALARAHPRSRGENGVIFSPPSWWRGSSPLTRGKRSVANELDHTHGLIPAHAGKTQSSSAWSEKAWAHPRSRGENTHGAPTAFSDPGSSPLTRGKRGVNGGAESLVGLIPAHAGKTRQLRRSQGRSEAHPRSRGENLPAPSVDVAVSGSSPLTRGKQPLAILSALWRGLIPAHAGKTPGQLGTGIVGAAHPRSRGENAFPSR